MGWNNNANVQLLLVSAGAGFSGVFVYSPGPSPGNLVASIAAVNGTDPFGNAYVGGVGAYSTGIGPVAAVELLASELQFRTAASSAGPYNINFQVLLDASNNLSLQGPAGGALSVLTPVSALTAIHPGAVSTAETWQNLVTAGLGVGFATGTNQPRYQYEGINGGRVRLSGDINLTANQAAGNLVFTLGVGYQPAQAKNLICPNNLSGAVASQAVLRISTAGQVRINVAGTSGNSFTMDGVTFELN